ncbi:phosphatase PAP2 family protein [Salmonella enterica subsp. enterica]|nr:phosphatase PAP2 family protein [Salmonella enterica subsp. enterica]
MTSGLVAKNAILDNGNCVFKPRALSRMRFLWMVLMVLRGFRLARHIMLFGDPRRGDYRRQGVKSYKERVQEPRPFVVWLSKNAHIPVDEFCAHFKAYRTRHLVKEQLPQQNIPVFLRVSTGKRDGLAFPSGHTMFAASWARFWPWVCAMAAQTDFHHRVLLVWATGVMGSRLLLGMHWLRDLVVHAHLPRLLVTPATRWRKGICTLMLPREEGKKLLNASRKADNG